MKVTENVTLYTCSYCSKYYIRKCNAVKHEIHCRNNPKNNHMCFNGCAHLVREREHNGDTVTTNFMCAKTGDFMYSYLAERNNLINIYPKGFIGVIRMPLKCELFAFAE